jgi:hypothetical protein
MKRYISIQEDYPVLNVEAPEPGIETDEAIDLPDSLVRRYERAVFEFMDVQEAVGRWCRENGHEDVLGGEYFGESHE